MKTKLNLRERKYSRCTVKVRYRIKICIFKSNVEFKQVCLQKQSSRGVLRKRCSENMQEIYGRTPMPKCGFNKVAKQLWNGCFSVPLCIPFSGSHSFQWKSNGSHCFYYFRGIQISTNRNQRYIRLCRSSILKRQVTIFQRFNYMISRIES